MCCCVEIHGVWNVGMCVSHSLWAVGVATALLTRIGQSVMLRVARLRCAHIYLYVLLSLGTWPGC